LRRQKKLDPLPGLVQQNRMSNVLYRFVRSLKELTDYLFRSSSSAVRNVGLP
jgi:hypothetical protein